MIDSLLEDMQPLEHLFVLLIQEVLVSSSVMQSYVDQIKQMSINEYN